MLINSIDYYQKLQSDLDKIATLFNNEDLHLNISKCATITFSRCLKRFINFNYSIQNSNLPRTINEIHDLGFILFPSLNPNLYVEKTCYKSLKMLGFFKWFLFSL